MKLRIAVAVVFVCGLVVFAFWLGGFVVESKYFNARCLSDCRFARLRVALLQYHSMYGTFPPAKYRATPNGPVHSWRVLLLPWGDMYTKELYSEYDFSAPWNSPHNLEIAKSVERHSYGYSIIDGDDRANYIAIGDGNEWPSRGRLWKTPLVTGRPLKACLITAGEDQFLLVEYPDSEIHWMDPKY